MSLTIRTDVTALKLYKNYVLAGIGSYINIYERETTKLLQRIECLKGQKIYRFVVSKCGEKVLVFGGKQFTVIAARASETGQEYYRVFEPILYDDWLHSGIWVEENVVAILSAHNVVQKWNTSKLEPLSSHGSKDNSILYSGLLVPAQDDLVVLAGTVFSEVIIHRCGSQKPLHHLKGHRGVIFSISCDTEKSLVVTTSDDRSVRIWSMINTKNHPKNTIDFWENITIECKNEVYGHSARVMRSFISNNLIVSVGEDAAICFWSYEGTLQKKISTHQNACIWSVDADDEYAVTGGGDNGISIHPLNVASEYGQNEVLDICETPKKLLFTARNNIVLLNESNELVYYDVSSQSKMVYKLNHESTYKLMSISSCKQIVAVVDMNGKLDVFIENCKETAYLMKIIDTKLQIGKILSMHWAGNRLLVFCCEDGEITVLAAKGNSTEIYANFKLPSCKERWLTSCGTDSSNKIIICGDRCGNIHCFVKSECNPIKTFKKVHGRYGPTSIKVRNNEIVTTGRDGTIKYFSIKEDVTLSKYMMSKELEFDWVEKFLDSKETLICGFQERVFVVYNIRTNTKILEVSCGGGHRSWDAVRCFVKVDDQFEEFIKMVYIKNSNVCLAFFRMSKIVSKPVVNGSHAKEINCLKTYKPDSDKSVTYYITGGEDTSLRVSSMNAEFHFQDEVVLKHLSNIRTLKGYPIKDNQLLIVSGGGRAQICVNKLNFEKVDGAMKVSTQNCIDYLLKGTDVERKHNKNWKISAVDLNPETRVMDLDAIRITENKFLVFAGCSDALLRIFLFTSGDVDEFKILKSIEHHKTCILKTQHMKISNKNVIVTCSTRGEVVFWIIVNEDDEMDIKNIFSFTASKCGINSFAYHVLADTNTIVIATGGDDNAIFLTLLQIDETSPDISITLLHNWSSDIVHSSQVTGLILLEDFLVSASIDQRVTLCQWKANEDSIECKFLSQMFSDVADIQGLELLEFNRQSLTVCVYGKGIEVLTINIPS